MSISILTTKLYIPPLRSESVLRPRLLEKLMNGLHSGCKLTLICAPAGSGKTTLAAEWVDHIQNPVNQAPDTIKTTWLLLDSNDNDPVVFLTYLVTALQRIHPEIGASALAMLEGSTSPTVETVTLAMANDLAALPDKVFLVLDDFHAIHNLVVQEAVSQFVEAQPPNVHLVITSRQDPLMPISRWRARRQVNEIRLADLRFTEEEAAIFLNHRMELNLTAEEIGILETRTEGWIAGLQLAAVSIQQGCADSPPDDFIRSFNGSDRFVMDYLIDEVLLHQPADVQSFLLKTSILERLCAPLCDALVNNLSEDAAGSLPQRIRSQEILDALDRANLFLVPLDHHRQWYRYHQLFAQLLQARLQMQYGVHTIRDLHRQAARWFAGNELIQEAVEHADLAKDYAWLADLLESYLKRPTTWSRGEVNRLLAWLSRLPEEVIANRPSLCMQAARCLHLSGSNQNARMWLEKAEHSLETQPLSEDNQVLRGMIAAQKATFLVMIGEDEQAVQVAEKALHLLPQSDALWRMRAMHALAMAQDELGNSDLCRQIYEEAIDLAQQTGNHFFALSTTGNLIFVLLQQGFLCQAAQLCQQTLDAANATGQITPAASLLVMALGGVAFERNQLAEAEKLLNESLRLAESGGLGLAVKNSGVLSSIVWLRLAAGDRSGAQKILTQLDHFFSTSESQWIRQQFNREAARAHLALAVDDLPYALHWARAYEQTGPTKFIRSIPDIVLARVSMAEGQPDKARLLLERLLADAVQRKQYRSVIEIRILLALTFSQLNKPEAARDHLLHAIEIAAPEGFLRLFAAEGETLQALIEDARRLAKTEQQQRFIEQVLSACSTTPLTDPVTAANQALVEPLTARELEVLRHLADGLTLSEIARKLYLSPNTLKAHTNNIYEKLDAHSRLQAVNKARDLGLID